MIIILLFLLGIPSTLFGSQAEHTAQKLNQALGVTQSNQARLGQTAQKIESIDEKAKQVAEDAQALAHIARQRQADAEQKAKAAEDTNRALNQQLVAEQHKPKNKKGNRTISTLEIVLLTTFASVASACTAWYLKKIPAPPTPIISVVVEFGKDAGWKGLRHALKHGFKHAVKQAAEVTGKTLVNGAKAY